MNDTQMTIGQSLTAVLRRSGSYTTGDQVKPGAILWTDPQQFWASAIGELKALLPELFVLGNYDPEHRTGPAIWLRCIEARTVDKNLPPEAVPVFYLPGVSRQQLREVEESPPSLQPLVELQFRGTVWVHPNGRDWTPYAFLTSERGGLGLDIAKDNATTDALLRALPRLFAEKVVDLRGHRLEADYFNRLLAPDPPRELLRWMSQPYEIQSSKNAGEWSAFCKECQAHYGFDPERDGQLEAGERLGRRENAWQEVWKRFSEAPQRYPGVVALLEKTGPSKKGKFSFDPEPWPKINDAEEKSLSEALRALKDKPPNEAAVQVRDLEKRHGMRREWVWRDLGRSQFAVAMEHLDRLAGLAEKPLAGPTAGELAEQYVQAGWKTDAAAMSALACCTRIEHEKPITSAVVALYSHWLDESARNLQTLVKSNPQSLHPRLGPVEATEGRIIFFVDGLRYDIAQELVQKLASLDLGVNLAWDWSPFPAVTPTSKPKASPIADLFTGADAGDEFAVTISSTGQRWTQERFVALLADKGVEVIEGLGLANTAGKAWLEGGTLDKHGHNEGWKLAKFVAQEVSDLAGQIQTLLSAGFSEVLVVTDHGWLLLPHGFPKAQLSKHVVEHRWGRCAAMKETGTTDLPLLPWFWNPEVLVASPPGVHCFKAGLEYVHGGISAQELVVPRISVTAAAAGTFRSKITSLKWVGLRCRVTIESAAPGLKVDLRGRAADASTSMVEGRQPRELAADGTVSLPVEDPSDEGVAAAVVLLSPDGRVIHSEPTIIGEGA